ncbi:Double-stranded RNA-binding protein Staufen protein 2 [Danaus plexippus plexippus]|uniref:Double-stranded RNA-binding protein Staufen protein 2 n=1 Tax=Danaus plexippus plexippus TaxID=278856 RepID=A0A212EGQ7_DANPL|nr:Double-stranded RNA-binding protein Staufen protein 2 [Danaus plexippus plexippus]
MMHHPNIHHQPMSGHPQHMPAHQPMPAHHQLPHQMHRENRHVTLTRVPLGPSQAGGMGAHAQLGGMGVHHAHHGRPHTIRAVHHPPTQHHNVPTPTRLRRPYGGGYTPGVVPFTQPPPMPPPTTQQNHNVVSGVNTKTPTPTIEAKESLASPTGTETSGTGTGTGNGNGNGSGTSTDADIDDKDKASVEATDSETRSTASANSKEKTPMCLVNELARYNKIKHQYRLTSETGPAHKKVFTVTLRLGDAEEYTAEGSSIKRAQHAAASAALSGTRYPPPPPRAPPPHTHHAHHHKHAGDMINIICYVFVRVRVTVGGRSWVGEGATPQGARHDAAARALHDLRSVAEHQDNDSGDAGSDNMLNSDVKSPVSLVHELALKRDLSVQFTVKSERGPPHMRVFVTLCTVGEMETEGEGNGKKISKRRAAERMLEEMRRRWPPALLRTRPPTDRRRHPPAKKKPRNLIKEGGEEAGCAKSNNGTPASSGGSDNPISRLAVARNAARARSPQYRVLEERGVARRREFLVQCDAPPHSATGLGPNKKTAKRRAAHNVLLAMELSASGDTMNSSIQSNGGDDTKSAADGKRKEDMNGGANSEVRQPVPGVILMDYHTRSGHPPQPNGVSESSATGNGVPVGAESVPAAVPVPAGGVPGATNTPGAKDQLMYLAQLLGFTVQFSDFPKRNHGEYLSLVSLSTEPPVMCHGGGASTAQSHEQCARAALRALALMGLDAPTTGLPSMSAAKPGPISNGIGE